MAGYADTKKLIEDTLTGRPAGTLILPEAHQNFALSLLDYIHSVELLGATTLQGFAAPTTVPIQPNNSRVSYISVVPPGATYNYANFHQQNGSSIVITSTEDEVLFVTLLWNKAYWQYQATPISFPPVEVVVESGDGENSIVQRNTGAKALGANSVATGHGEIQLAESSVVRNSDMVVGSQSYPNYDCGHVHDFRVGQTVSSSDDGSNIRVIVALGNWDNSNNGYRSFAINEVFDPELPSSSPGAPVYLVTGVAYGENSHIEGNGCFALNRSAHAEGTGSIAYGKYSHAEGLETQIVERASYGHAEGKRTVVDEEAGHAESYETKAMAKGSHAEGYKSETSKTGYSSNTLTPKNQPADSSQGWWNGASHAEGNATIAQGIGAHAEGEKTFASERATHAEGRKSVAKSEYSHAEGNNTTAGAGHDSGTAAHAEGESTQATAWATHAEGYQSKANAWVAHAEGANALAGTGSRPSKYTDPDDPNDDEFGRFAHAEGNACWAKGSASHAEGLRTQALVKYSHAEGNGTTASHEAAHAEGWETIASGDSSHAEGWQNQATGATSHAEGYGSVASKEGSHVEGRGTKVSNNYEHAEGKWNQSNTGTVHSIGVGTSNTSRFNAFEVLDNGTVYVKGVGLYFGTHPQSGVNDLATFLNSLLPVIVEGTFDDSVGEFTPSSSTSIRQPTWQEAWDALAAGRKVVLKFDLFSDPYCCEIISGIEGGSGELYFYAPGAGSGYGVWRRPSA